ncbi:hypothetical protein SY83_22075 [Paenibacillus swuensis]|uniref:HTH araC/xylS-type domain-containing protein n=1 Tax=Paenibacillus swuensis TaxID=1178515 RepID=A0A172TNQ0_9BACL|nr:AraC family transcriptional regulator [Paenibacillus swuensis]ANE48524.1 hypothetical protein SY83_22075 [Paenibacillus swuensis]
MRAWQQKGRTTSTRPIHSFETGDIEYSPHWHDEIEVVYVMQGRQRVGLNQDSYTLGEGDLFLIHSGQVHHYAPLPEGSRVFIIQYGLTLYDELAEKVRVRIVAQPHIPKPRQGEDGKLYMRLLKPVLELYQESLQQDQECPLAVKASIYELMKIVYRDVPHQVYSGYEQTRHRTKLERLQHVFDYVEAHYANELKLNQLAAVSNMSVYHFSRFFKEATGMTVGRYITSYRVTEADRLLQLTDVPVTEIAYRCGFRSIPTFNRVFKQLRGCSPSAVRKINLS